MRYILIISLLFVTACSSNYAYKPGTLASDENFHKDQDFCQDKAYSTFVDGSKSNPPLILLAFGALGGAAYSSMAQQTDPMINHSKEMDVIVHNCMASKGYINKG